MALTTGHSAINAFSPGLQAGQTSGVTTMWKREADTWRLFIRHAMLILSQ